MSIRVFARLMFSLLALACQAADPSEDASIAIRDAIVPDATVPDASIRDATVRDAAPPDASSTDASSDAGPTVSGTTYTYIENEAAVGSPERGFYGFAEVADTTDLSRIADNGYRLAFSYVHLDDYRDSDIPSAFLDDVGRGFDAARAAGIKIVLRFAYNLGPYPDTEPDAPLARILAHLEQLRPLLAAHADVIAVVQAGFVGAWGEWHTSTNRLTDDPATRRAIIEGLVDALPDELSTQIRLPAYKQEMFGAAITAANAHDGSYAARVGHHNDCFLSSDTDVGTYPSDDPDRVRSYVAADTRFVPMGGETCARFPSRSDCAPALAEFERLHVSYMNDDYHPDVVSAWRDQGCYEELAMRMGYRLVVESAVFPDSMAAGARARIEVTIRNEGWAAPFNPRAIVVQLGDDIARVELDRDARWLLAGESTTLTGTLDVPAGASGAHSLSVAAPDAHPSIADRPEYALPFANVSYDASTGRQPLGSILVE